MNKYLILLLLFYACDNPTSSEIPPINGDGGAVYNYNMNLSASNSGSYINYATITWSKYHNHLEDFISYTIRDENETISELEDLLNESYDIELNPETFYKVYLDMNTHTTTYTDSIQIFTRSVKPITNLTTVADSGNWFTSLNWNASNETESNFSHYNIYRAFENDDIFNDLETCDCLIANLQTQNVASYIDSIDLVWGGGYYYLIETITNQGYKRKSIIQSNILNESYNPQIINDGPYASDSEYNKIIINWEHNLDQNKFYALEIWRSNSEDIDPFNQTQLVTITNYNKNNFEDYYEIGDGALWFYKIKLIDVYGNTNESNIITGNTHP
jgi:hypothetical protein